MAAYMDQCDRGAKTVVVSGGVGVRELGRALLSTAMGKSNVEARDIRLVGRGVASGVGSMVLCSKEVLCSLFNSTLPEREER